MPTARELLEQADALMRKGRGTGAGAVPPQEPSPEASRSPYTRVTSPRAIQREPIAASEALASMPAAAPESSVMADLTAEIALPLAEPFDALDPGRAETAGAVDIPTLEEAVTDSVLEGVAPDSNVEDSADEFPVLTDAVDADVVARIDDIAGGELPQADVAASRHEAPEADAAVSAREESETDAVPSGLAEPEVDAVTPAREETAEGGTAIPIAGFAPLGPQPGYDIHLSVDFEDVAAPASAEATAGGQGAEATTGDQGAEAPAADESPVGHAAMPDAPPPAIGAELAAEASAPQEIDDERIDEAVDAIRMQVLQRIDIFTDTTLRARLGEELQPLVERASAELVAAINQHVGEWLRTYVAEVLEQEIGRWRNGQR